jgi:hypothetical protein
MPAADPAMKAATTRNFEVPTVKERTKGCLVRVLCSGVRVPPCHVWTWLPIGFLGVQNILVAREKVRAYYGKVSGIKGVSL